MRVNPTLQDWRTYAPRVVKQDFKYHSPQPRVRLEVNGKRETFSLSDEMFWDWIFEVEPLPENRLRYEPVEQTSGWSDTTEF